MQFLEMDKGGRGTRIQSLEMDEGGRRMASAWNTKKKSNSAMKEKELGAVTQSRKRTKRMKPAFDAELTDEVRRDNIPRKRTLEGRM